MLEKAILSESKTFYDNRGQFTPVLLDLEKNKWIQSNVSISTLKNTFRGLHYQEDPFSQAKLIKVIKGRILDIVVDLREDSPDFNKAEFFMLNPDNQLYVPRNFAHGFLTLEDDCIVQYHVDNEYSKENERTLFWNEVRELNEILKDINLVISEKDNPNL
jgi:dTDP-4-dehydrorhamnose 3,5-epimerase